MAGPPLLPRSRHCRTPHQASAKLVDKVLDLVGVQPRRVLHDHDVIPAIERVGPALDAGVCPRVLHDHGLAQVARAGGPDTCHAELQGLQQLLEASWSETGSERYKPPPPHCHSATHT